jgi:hypothetical protein
MLSCGVGVKQETKVQDKGDMVSSYGIGVFCPLGHGDDINILFICLVCLFYPLTKGEEHFISKRGRKCMFPNQVSSESRGTTIKK